MYIYILLFPLLSSIICGFFGYKIGAKGASIISVSLLTLTFLISCFIFYEVALMGSPCYIHLNNWIDSGLFNLQWGLMFDTLTAVMLIVVTSISMFVHLYSIEYMKMDPHKQRFLSYLSFFTFFMLILVTADNFLQMFLGWEGVGLCSYLLINFWYGRIQANKAALKAMIINRIGDFGLAISIFIMFFIFKTLDYSTIFAIAPKIYQTKLIIFNIDFDALTLICIFLFIGAVGKSAQIGLHSWLPDAMEGPTPVSALIHAATMVTAGVFLIARCSPLFQYAPTASTIVTLLGAMTAFLAATTGLVQNDLKRVIAYSTCSQLGYMIFACGISNYAVGIFHLANHAFFKALLFLSAGSVIHAMSDEQDMRKMGGLIKLLPFTYSMFFIGSMALAGSPFLSGFYSKDVILELAYSTFSIEGHFAYWLGSISAFFTAFYSTRLLVLTFINYPESSRYNYSHVHEAPWKMAIPLFCLAWGSIFIGYISRDMMIGLGTDFWGNALFIHPRNYTIIDAEFLDTDIKLIPSILSINGFFLSLFLYSRESTWITKLLLNNYGYYLYTFFNRKWFFDKIYNEYIAQSFVHIAYIYTYQNGDRGIIELLGPHGISTSLYIKSKNINKIKVSFVFHYLFIIFFSIFCLLTFLCLWNIIIIFIDWRIILLCIMVIWMFF